MHPPQSCILSYNQIMRACFRAYSQLLMLMLLVAAVAFVWYAVFSESGDALKVVMLDVGQGDAFFIRAPGGAQVLIDGGPGDRVLAQLGKVMPFYDRSIDALILSHPHADHLSGLVEVLKRYRVGMVMDSGTAEESGVYEEWKRLLADFGVPHYRARRGVRLLLGGGAVFDVLLPTHDVAAASPHDGMLVGLLRYGEAEMFFSGDMEERLETYLLALGPLPDIEVLKVGHHGSRTSSFAPLISALQPEHAFISVGSKNSYQHPHEEALGRIAAAGAAIWRSDENGAMLAQSDGENFSVRPLYCVVRVCW